ncbi:MAG: response regulator transcription factor [Opitutaceae bacterium]|nr:response regulator transcription factor [Opitutaceae bacterium]
MTSGFSDPPIRILVVDNSELVRAGLKTLLADRLDGREFTVVSEADTVAAAITAADRFEPDVVLVDVRLPDGSGFTACREILTRRPQTRVVVLTSFIDNQLIHEAMRSGVHGYLLKDIKIQNLRQALTEVAGGRHVFDPTASTQLLNLVRAGGPHPEADRVELLSPQERRVLALVAEGKTNKEIAAQMKLSDKTVKNYLSRAFEKLHITRRAQAAVIFAGHKSRSDRLPAA